MPQMTGSSHLCVGIWGKKCVLGWHWRLTSRAMPLPRTIHRISPLKSSAYQALLQYTTRQSHKWYWCIHHTLWRYGGLQTSNRDLRVLRILIVLLNPPKWKTFSSKFSIFEQKFSDKKKFSDRLKCSQEANVPCPPGHDATGMYNL